MEQIILKWLHGGLIEVFNIDPYTASTIGIIIGVFLGLWLARWADKKNGIIYVHKDFFKK